MRDLLNKLLTGSMVAGAALVVSACGGSESANTVENTTVTEMDAMEPVDGATNDVTAVDGAGANAMGGNMSADANMTMDSNMTSGNMSSGNMMSGNMTTTNTTTTTTNTATGNMTNAM
ncbi:MAG: hypothetical protein AVDCRST_MAG91-2347 [uncultured Sphingomonadaceae bacterium]|uniref:Uncharacterized protein n=1 Tax=uncultured Sphingomonadaceae bacterium TaxID=169976 RepID=A0A6J4THM5_9SPHN|nr:MAG: hypothetical protein AVDCRST_MAG91-2347 [uncultured Sphingomonadaceae bacterium]